MRVTKFHLLSMFCYYSCHTLFPLFYWTQSTQTCELAVFLVSSFSCAHSLYPPQTLFVVETLFVVGILFSRCPCVRVCVRASVRPSVTFCFFNILKSYCWIFIKPCKHVHICKTNTLDKKVRARGQFY